MQVNIDVILENLKEIQSKQGYITSSDVSQQLIENNVSILHIQDVMDAIHSSGLAIKNDTQQETVQRRGDNFTFSDLCIFPGTTLVFTKNPNETCVVISDKKVLYNNEEYYLSGLAKKLLHEIGHDWQSVRGPGYFRTIDNMDTLEVRYKKNKDNFIRTPEPVVVKKTTEQVVGPVDLKLPIEHEETEEEMVVRVVRYGKDFWQRVKAFAETNSYLKILEKGVLAYFFRFNRIFFKYSFIKL